MTKDFSRKIREKLSYLLKDKKRIILWIHFQMIYNILASCLAKFDAPHQIIHSIAFKVKEMEEKEDFDSAYEIINRTKDGELSEMIKLFSEARSLLKETTREIALILEWEDNTMAVGVDSVKTVEKFSESNIEDLPGVTSSLDNESIAGIGKRRENNELVQLLDVGKLICEERNLVVEIPKE